MITTDTYIPAKFDGFEYDAFDLLCRVLEASDGVAWVAATYLDDPDIQDGGIGILWAKDDAGRIHYAVSDCNDGMEYAASREEAWSVAVAMATHVIDPERPVDVAYDHRIPAVVYGDRADLLRRIPTN